MQNIYILNSEKALLKSLLWENSQDVTATRTTAMFYSTKIWTDEWIQNNKIPKIENSFIIFVNEQRQEDKQYDCFFLKATY